MRYGAILAGLFCLALMLCSVAVVSAEDKPLLDIVGFIETAKTSQDHEALADRYREEADHMRSKVESHQIMVKVYTRKFGNRIDKWLPHCEALIESYREAAQSYEALAIVHEREAVALRSRQ